MKNFLVFILLLGCSYGYTQPNWKDSVKIKEKVLDAYKLDDVIYFKTKKGWGAYWPIQSYLQIQPGYQFLIDSPDRLMNVFYAVKKNKLIMIDKSGKQVDKRSFNRIGKGGPFDQQFSIENDVCTIKSGDTITEKFPYRQLTNKDEYSVTLKGNLVYINIYTVNQPFPLQTSINGDVIDSIDVNGNQVMQQNPPTTTSGIFDLKTSTWLVPLTASKVGFVGNNSLVLTTTEKNNVLEEKISVLDKSFQQKGQFSREDSYIKANACKIILSDYSPVAVEPCLSHNGEFNLFQIYKFDTGKKQGLYDPFSFNIIMEPVKYDFVHLSESFEKNIFTVEGKKVGFNANTENKIAYQNEYNKLNKSSYFINYLEQNFEIMNCDNSDFEVISEQDTGHINHEFKMRMKGFVKNSGIEVAGDFVIVHEFIPKEIAEPMPIVIYDMDGNMRDSVITEPSGEQHIVYMPSDPGKSLSGVFNLITRSWIVPRKFSNIMKTDIGFSCVRYYKDTVSFSFYSKDGKEVFNGINLNQLLANTDYVNKFTGSIPSANLQVKLAFDFNINYAGLPIIVKDGKKAGLFDVHNLTWIIKSEYDLIDFNSLLNSYYLVRNNKIGLADINGTIMAEPLFTRSEYNFGENGYILDDSLFCLAAYPFKTVVIDNSRNFSRQIMEGDQVNSKPFQRAEIMNKKLYVEESEIFMHWTYLYDNEIIHHKYFSNTRMIDPQSGKEKIFNYAVRIKPWKNGHLVLDTLARWIFVNEKDEQALITTSGNIQFNKNYVYTTFRLPGYRLAENGTITFEADEDYNPDLFGEFKPVGFVSNYFDGEKVYDLPADFYLLALNKAKVGIGFTLAKNSNNTFDKKYTYFDFNTRKFVPVEMDLTGTVNLEVVDLGDYYLFYKEVANNGSLLLMESDLKTVKSTFNNLESFRWENTSDPENRKILFELDTKAGKQMFFDKDFQYILEADKGAYEISYPRWDRLVMTQGLNTLKMNLKGQILNK